MNRQTEIRARTRAKLIDAFWKLCNDKNINQISVGELARLAGYNRSTFYEYFSDIPDLVSQVENELLENIRQNLTENAPRIMNNDMNGNSEFFHTLYQMLNEPIYCLLGPHGDPSFFSRIKETAAPVFSAFFSQPEESEYFDYIFSYAYSAVVGYMQHWHEQGQDLSEEKFFRLGYALMSQGVLGALAQINQF